MKTIVTIIFIIDENTFEKSLSNLLNQTYKNLKIIIFNKLDKTINISDPRIFKVIDAKNLSFNQILLLSLDISNSKYISFTNSNDIFSLNKIEEQVEYLNATDLNIVSCKSELLPEYKSRNSANYYDNFITSSDIDFAIESSYISVDFYTFLIRVSFLNLLKSIIVSKKISSPLDFTLMLLKYSKIEKLNSILCYLTIQRLPYDENINLDNKILSNNTISLFLKNNPIQNRTYLNYTLFESSNEIFSLTTSKSILILLETPLIGGTETYILSMCKQLLRLGIKTYIIYYDGIFSDVFTLNNIECIKSKTIFENFKNKNFNNCFHELNSFIQKHNISTLYLHTPSEIELGYKFKSFYKNISIIVTLHGIYYTHILIKDSSYYIDKFIVVSDVILNYYTSCFDTLDKVTIIYNSLELCNYKLNNSIKNELNLKDTDKILTYASRLSTSKSKCAIIFLQTILKLLEEGYDLYAIVLGDGDNFSHVNELANSINSKFGQKVFMLGFVYNVLDYYNSSFLVIGTGRVAIESLSVKTPVIPFGLAGLSNVVQEDNIVSLLKTNFCDHNPNLLPNINSYSEFLFNEIKYLIDNPIYTQNINLFFENFYENNLNIEKSAKKIRDML